MNLTPRVLTPRVLAQACGVTRQTIIALEAGRYAPSLELAFHIRSESGSKTCFDGSKDDELEVRRRRCTTALHDPKPAAW